MSIKYVPLYICLCAYLSLFNLFSLAHSKKKDDDDDIVSSVTESFIDPWSKRNIDIPVRNQVGPPLVVYIIPNFEFINNNLTNMSDLHPT